MTLEELQEMIDEADRDGDGEVNEANVVANRFFGGMVKLSDPLSNVNTRWWFFDIFLCSPRKLTKWSYVDSYFFKGVETTNQLSDLQIRKKGGHGLNLAVVVKTPTSKWRFWTQKSSCFFQDVPFLRYFLQAQSVIQHDSMTMVKVHHFW